MQHVVLRATWYEGTAQLLSLTECKSFSLSFVSLAEPLTDEADFGCGFNTPNYYLSSAFLKLRQSGG